MNQETQPPTKTPSLMPPAASVPQPLRVLITCGIFPPDLGVPATWAPQFIKHLLAHGHRVTVITRSEVRGHPIDHALGCKALRLPRSQGAGTQVVRAVAAITRLGRGCDAILVAGMFLEAVLANRVLHKPLLGRVPGALAWEMSLERG